MFVQYATADGDVHRQAADVVRVVGDDGAEAAVARVRRHPVGGEVAVGHGAVQRGTPFGVLLVVEPAAHGAAHVEVFGLPLRAAQYGPVLLYAGGSGVGAVLQHGLYVGPCGLGQVLHLAGPDGRDDQPVAPLIVLVVVACYGPRLFGFGKEVGHDVVVGCAVARNLGWRTDAPRGHVAQFVGHLDALHEAGVEEDVVPLHARVAQYVGQGRYFQFGARVAACVLSVVDAYGLAWHFAGLLRNPSRTVRPQHQPVVACRAALHGQGQHLLHGGAVGADEVGRVLVEQLFALLVVEGQQFGPLGAAVVQVDHHAATVGYVAHGAPYLFQVVLGKGRQRVFGHHVDNHHALRCCQGFLLLVVVASGEEQGNDYQIPMFHVAKLRINCHLSCFEPSILQSARRNSVAWACPKRE